LPNESKEILRNNKIITSAPTSKPPIFNYASFCRDLSINQVHNMVKKFIKNQRSNPPISTMVNIVERELHKLFMNQISSLKKLTYLNYPNTTLTIYPEAKNWLKDLSELECSSDINSEFFYQLSQICCNLQILNIRFGGSISNGLL